MEWNTVDMNNLLPQEIIWHLWYKKKFYVKNIYIYILYSHKKVRGGGGPLGCKEKMGRASGRERVFGLG